MHTVRRKKTQENKKRRAPPCIIFTTYPWMVAWLLFGADLPPADAEEDAGAKRPKLAAVPCASRSFCSSASARRFRKSERWTRPTVWDASRSAAVEAWVVKRGFGVGVKFLELSFEEEGGFDEAMGEMRFQRLSEDAWSIGGGCE